MVYFEIKEASSLALSVDGASQRPKAKRKNKDMGYKANSPVKQIWLPLDFGFIAGMSDEPFGYFARVYKEKFGIDLHDVFELVETGDYFHIHIKGNCLVSTYSCGLDKSSLYGSTLATCDGIIDLLSNNQQTSPVNLITIGVGAKDVFGFGFVLRLPRTGSIFNSIDDLLVTPYEV